MERMMRFPCFLVHAVPCRAQFDSYIWEAHQATGISADSTARMLQILRREVSSIVDARHLRALRAYHTDVATDGYVL